MLPESRYVLLMVTILLASVGLGQDGTSAPKRPITVEDAITMATWAGTGSWFGDSDGTVASFSPDGKRFLVVVKKGNLENNTNEFSLYAFETSQVFHLGQPKSLLTMASSSNREGIRKIKWLGNETIAFLGENPGESAQVYTFNLRTRHLEKRTNHPTPITGYDITESGELLVFTADPPLHKSTEAVQSRRSGTVISNQELSDLLAGDCAKSWEQDLFIQMRGVARHIVIEDAILPDDPLSLSPDGRYALVGVQVRHIPDEWRNYRARSIRMMLAASEPWAPSYTGFGRYMLLKVEDGSVVQLLDEPMVGFSPTVWATDSRSVFIKSVHLPLDVGSSRERKERKRLTYDVEVNVATLAWRKIKKRDWPKRDNTRQEVNVKVEQDLNTPPQIRAFNVKTGQASTLIDLNPGFKHLKFGLVKTIILHVKGLVLSAGLYLPPDYSPGKRYPLVIQTHGYIPTQFSMDGRSEWSSAFAARPLAAHGIVVLQTYGFEKKQDHDRLVNGEDKRFGRPPEFAARNLATLVYEDGINYLRNAGLIDDRRVGIVGFSRTVCFVASTLTHSKYRFAAASLVDGIDCGYFQHLAFPVGNEDDNLLNGGRSPFTRQGLQQWLRESPGFNLYRVHTPMRLVALQRFAVLEGWEWFVGLKLQRKPVDFIELPDASHIIVKPWERMSAQQGLVDWFRFWLEGEEDPDPAKASQYRRWRRLRQLQHDQPEGHVAHQSKAG